MLALGTAKTLFDFAGQRTQASSVEAQSRHEAMIYGVNADLAREQAEDAIARGRESELKYLRQSRQFMGAQRARAGASGALVDNGSLAQIGQESLLVRDQDLLKVRNNAAREAWGYNVEAANFDMRAELTRRAGKNQASAIRAASYGTLLGGAIDTYGHYSIAKKG